MGLLKFFAREGLVRDPECVPAIGQAARYLGREFVPASKDGATVIPPQYPATREGFSCAATSEIGRVAIKGARKGAFWAGDETTAAACGLAFVELEFTDGVWDAAKPKTSTGSRAASKAAE